MARPGLDWARPTGPARPTNFWCDGLRPGPARQILRGLAAARPGPSNFLRMGRGPGEPITFGEFHGPARPGTALLITFSNVSARPGPAHDMVARPMEHGFHMDRAGNYVGGSAALTGRPMCCSVPKRACTHYADVKFQS